RVRASFCGACGHARISTAPSRRGDACVSLLTWASTLHRFGTPARALTGALAPRPHGGVTRSCRCRRLKLEEEGLTMLVAETTKDESVDESAASVRNRVLRAMMTEDVELVWCAANTAERCQRRHSRSGLGTQCRSTSGLCACSAR